MPHDTQQSPQTVPWAHLGGVSEQAAQRLVSRATRKGMQGGATCAGVPIAFALFCGKWCLLACNTSCGTSSSNWQVIRLLPQARAVIQVLGHHGLGSGCCTYWHGANSRLTPLCWLV